MVTSACALPLCPPAPRDSVTSMSPAASPGAAGAGHEAATESASAAAKPADLGKLSTLEYVSKSRGWLAGGRRQAVVDRTGRTAGRPAVRAAAHPVAPLRAARRARRHRRVPSQD